MVFTVIRLPGFDRPVIWVPDSYMSRPDFIERYDGVLSHELVHCHQQSTWWGVVMTLLQVTVLPLPVFFSGRWFVERHAYLRDIRRKKKTRYNIRGDGKIMEYSDREVMTPEIAAQKMWDQYGWPWPKRLMVKWFKIGIYLNKL